jgi:hypothetical protein
MNDLLSSASDVRQFAECAAHDADSGRNASAVEFAQRAAEAADRAARAARDVARECAALPAHRCENCAEPASAVDEWGMCDACAQLSSDERHAVLCAAVEAGRFQP